MVTRNIFPLKTVKATYFKWKAEAANQILTSTEYEFVKNYGFNVYTALDSKSSKSCSGLKTIKKTYITAEKQMYAGKSYSATLSVLPVQPVTKPVLISLKNSVTVLIRLLTSVMDVRKPSIIVPLLTSTVTMLSLQTANTRNVCLRPGLV